MYNKLIGGLAVGKSSLAPLKLSMIYKCARGITSVTWRIYTNTLQGEREEKKDWASLAYIYVYVNTKAKLKLRSPTFALFQVKPMLSRPELPPLIIFLHILS